MGGVIVGARNAQHVVDHARLFRIQLASDDLAAIEDVLQRGQRPRGDCYTWERGGSW